MNLIFAVMNDPPCIVTKDGRIFSKRYKGHNFTERVQTINQKGYYTVTLKNKSYRVHRIVAEAWFGKCPKGLEVDHIDRNKLNNNVNNLRYATRSLNCYNRRTSDNTTFNIHWGSSGSEQHKIANRIYKQLKRKQYSDTQKHELSKLIHCKNKERLSSLDLFRTVRIIDGKRTNVVLPLSEKYVRRRDTHGRFTYSRAD